MKDSEVYLRAAELIDSGELDRSCWAIGCVSTRLGLRASSRINRYVKAVIGTDRTSDLFDEIGVHWDGTEAKGIRVLALLFMRQIALDEERKRK